VPAEDIRAGIGRAMLGEREPRLMARSKKAAAPPEKWSAEVGLYPNKVIVEENPHRKGGLYLRWWRTDVDNWGGSSLGNIKLGKILRDNDGSINQDVATWAVEQAMRKSQELSGSLARGSAKRSASRSVRSRRDHRQRDGQVSAQVAVPRRARESDPVRRDRVGKGHAGESIDEDQWTKLIRDARLEGLVARERRDLGHGDHRLETHHRVSLAPKEEVDPDRRRRDRRRLEGGSQQVLARPHRSSSAIRSHISRGTRSMRCGRSSRPRLTWIRGWRSCSTSPRSSDSARRRDRCAAISSSTSQAEFGELQIYGAGHKGGEVVELTKGMRIASTHT
jgi:hypothetical protein